TALLTATAATETYPLSLHDALPISPPTAGGRRTPRSGRSPSGSAAGSAPFSTAPRRRRSWTRNGLTPPATTPRTGAPCWTTARRSEEHTSELQSRENLVCRLLLEKK